MENCSLPLFLFQLPQEDSSQGQQLAHFLDTHKQDCTPYLPWLTGEMLESVGGKKTLAIMRQHGASRVHMQDLYLLLKPSERLLRTLEMNSGGDGMLEVQSVSGFISDMRRYTVEFLVKRNTKPHEIIRYTGVSMRTIQRVRHQRFAAR